MPTFVVIAVGGQEPVLSKKERIEAITRLSGPYSKVEINAIVVKEDFEPGEKFRDLLLRLREKYAELFATNKITLVAI